MAHKLMSRYSMGTLRPKTFWSLAGTGFILLILDLNPQDFLRYIFVNLSSFQHLHIKLKDNPADFSYYFDSSNRRNCYLAPERFCAPGDALFSTDNKLTAAMDIFSVGCTIAELFLEGIPLFSFSQLLRYRMGEYDPIMVLEKIPDEDVKVSWWWILFF